MQRSHITTTVTTGTLSDAYQCHSERSEESRVHKVGVTEILRYALDDKMIGNFYYDTPSYVLFVFYFPVSMVCNNRPESVMTVGDAVANLLRTNPAIPFKISGSLLGIKRVMFIINKVFPDSFKVSYSF